MKLNYDAGDAVAEIQAKVASQRNVLPKEANDPVIDVQTGSRLALMYLAFHSDSMSPMEMTDYLLRVVQPQIQAIEGVAKARMFGKKTYAMRIWLDPKRMVGRNVTASDVREALMKNNYLSGVGETKGTYVAVDLSATTDIVNPEEFNDLIVREENGVIVRLSDVADAELGAEDYESTAWYNGNTALFIGVTPTPGSNPPVPGSQAAPRRRDNRSARTGGRPGLQPKAVSALRRNRERVRFADCRVQVFPRLQEYGRAKIHRRTRPSNPRGHQP